MKCIAFYKFSVTGTVYQRQQLKTATGNDACIISWVSDNVIGSGDNARRLYEVFGLVCLKFPDTGQEKILRISLKNMASKTVSPDVEGYKKALADYIGGLAIEYIDPSKPQEPVEEAGPPEEEEAEPQDISIVVSAQPSAGEDGGHDFPIAILKGYHQYH